MREEYKELTDEDLIDRLRRGEHEIVDYLMDKYKNLVKSKARSMYILGSDSEDLIQEGMIGLFKAVRDYDSGRDASFSTFAELCVTRQMYTAVQASNRKKHLPLNSYISLDIKSGEESEGEENWLLDLISSKRGMNPEELIIDQENVARIDELMNSELSAFEKEVMDLYLTGMTYTQIAHVLGHSVKSTDNALQRIKAKLKKIL